MDTDKTVELRPAQTAAAQDDSKITFFTG